MEQRERLKFMMKTTRHKILTITGMAWVILLSISHASDKPDNRPNIIFIMADDHASHAISAYGSRLINTPNIDRLAREGVRFTNCFNVNSLCAPSRACLITGKYNFQNGFKINGDKFNGTQLTFPKLLQKAGYETVLIGKWHLKTQPTGFDDYSIIPGHGRYFDPVFYDSEKPWGETTKNKGYITEIITDKAIKWMNNRVSNKPFCLMVHHKAPHGPYLYPKKYEKLYADKDLPVPETFSANHAQRSESLAKTQGRWSKLDDVIPNHFNKKVPKELKRGTVEYKNWAYQNIFKGYLRLLASLDENVGRLLDHIDKSEISKNTIVIYTSDNGFFLGDFGLFNKMWMYEESLRLPLVVRYPDHIKAKTVNRDMVSILDFAPTFLDYAQVNIPGEMQGHSIRPLLEAKTPVDWRKAHYYHYYGQYDVPAHYGVRTKTHKLIHYYKQDRWELFDLVKDPREMQNSYHKPEQSQIVENMKTILKKLRKKYEGALQTGIEQKNSADKK